MNTAASSSSSSSAAGEAVPEQPWPRVNAALWVWTGLWAGVAVGAADTLWAVARGVGGLGVVNALKLVLLGSSWLGTVGGITGALIALGGALAARAGRRRALAGAALAAAVMAPFVWTVAFAAFSGRRAMETPGRPWVCAGLGLLGTAAVFELTRRFHAADARLLARGATGGGQNDGQGEGQARRRPSGGVLAAAGVLIVVAAVAAVANQEVLKRLYPWFHASLAAVSGALVLLAFRLVLADGPRLRSRLRGKRLGVAAALVFVVAALAGAEVRRSQGLRFAAWERTTVTAQVLRLSPAAARPRVREPAGGQATTAALPALPEGPARPDADVVVITVDALRADHLGAAGYTRHPTTPQIDKLAARSVRFAHAYAQAPHTSFSVASMLTGKYFPTLARLAPAEVHDPIGSVLRQYSWHTAGFYPPAIFFVDAQKLKAYADSNFSFEYVKFEYLEAQQRVDQVIRYFDDEKPKRAFVWVHFFEPHEPYVAHPEFPFGAGDIDRYDSEIAYVDAAIGRLLGYLNQHRPGAVVMLAADHGEEFDEHGGRYHGSSLFDEQIRVPLMISVPGVPARVVERPVELIDIAPTVLGLLDIPIPARMRGTNLGPWLATPPADEARLPPAFAEVEDKRMIVFGREKLICDLNWGYCAYHDLTVDPGERRNMADERPDRAAALRAMLDEWLDGHVRFEPVLARGASNPDGESIPKAIERGRLGDLLAGPALAALMLSADEKVAVRREAAELLVVLPSRKETAAQLSQAMNDPDPVVAGWAAVGAVRAGNTQAVGLVVAMVADERLPRMLRVRGALALGARDNRAGVPVLASALDECQEDVLFCRLVIIELGKLKDRRAVPALLKHLPQVQNRREMVDALGDIGDADAIPALVERLRHDEYVPVRAQAARALAKIGLKISLKTGREVGWVDVVPVLEAAAREDTEASVGAAAREAIATLRGRSPRL
ncbi:MAG: sulfatase-like hydrolase/transferase [Bacteroidota bacterium]